MSQCKQCGNQTDNPVFCSRSCSASFNNHKLNGRKTGRKRSIVYCKACGSVVDKTRRTFCSDCISSHVVMTPKGVYIKIQNAKKKDVMTNDTQRHRKIRHHAQKVAREHGLLKSCLNCNYSLYVESCHRKPIKDFDDDALVSEINHPSNLVGLCPNCHWEFDHGFLALKN